MSLITVIWSMVAAACLTLGGVHVLVWFRNREAIANLMFSLLAAGTAGMAACELLMAHAQTTADYGRWLRLFQVAVWLVFLALAGFIHFHLRAWRPGLAWIACLVRTAALVLNFCTGINLNYREITSLQHVPFLGGTAAVASGVPNPAMAVGQVGLVILLVYVAGAAVKTWQRGDRRGALLVGAGTVFFVFAGTVQALLVFWGFVATPISASLFFAGMLAAMSFELSSDLLRAARVDRELRQREVQLRDSEERVNLAAESASAGFWSLDPATGKFWTPPRTLELLGFAPSIALDLETFLSAVHPDDRERVSETVREALRSRQPARVEYRFVQPDGSVRRMVSLGRSRLDEQGRLSGLMGVSIDVTSLRMTEEALTHERTLTQAVFDSVPGLLYLYTQDGAMVRWNRKHEELTGYSAEELARMNLTDWFSEEDLAPVRREWEKIFTEGRTTAEILLRRKDGTKVPCLATGVRVELEGKPHMVGIAMDITQRKRLEEESKRHFQELAHVSRVAIMGELTASLAHELNQPLGAILRNAETARILLRRDPPDMEELRAIVADICRDDHRASDVIERLRDLLKQKGLQPDRLEAGTLIGETISLVRAEAVEHHVRLMTEISPGLPPVMGDRVQLQQVLLNLLVNAFDAVKEQPDSRRHVLITARDAGEGRVELGVQDSGNGIRAEDIPRLFDSFFTRKAGGLGMGLSICRTIVEAHGGRIRAENNPEGGATFSFTLPAAAANEPA